MYIPPSHNYVSVFGTTVDWRLSVATTLSDYAHAALSSATSSLPSVTRLNADVIDWAAFAQAWRNTFKTFIANYPNSSTTDERRSRPFKTVDQHHHESLIDLLHENGLESLWSAEEVLEISRAWHVLKPWPDSSAGITQLNSQGLQTCTLSNGNISLLSDIAKHAELPWMHIFSSEHFRAYKPSPEVYIGAVQKLGLKVEECAMVAAHLGDLRAARDCGLKTIYVEREEEEDYSIEEIEKARSEGWVNIWIGLHDGKEGERGFLAVARRLADGA
ncbi:hypothetical protein MMC06_004177 [Schaereria dolodes]|nr:hypothetical protein [Schaereria dolodes]